jgi:hypothetical protein
VDKYCCLRCQIKSSFKASYDGAAKLVNAWMRPGDTAKAMDIKRQKIVKRMNRDSRELAILGKELKSYEATREELSKKNEELLTEVIASAAAVATFALKSDAGVDDSVLNVVESSVSKHTTPVSDETNGMEVAAQDEPSATSEDNLGAVAEPSASDESVTAPIDLPTIAATVTSVESKISEIKGNIFTLQSRLSRAKKDEDDIATFFCLDVQGRYHVTEWMLAMQKILWPSSTDEEALGRPVAKGLPAGVTAHMEAAKKLGIHELPDVRQLEDYFLWMAWCYHCLEYFRQPPKSSELRELLAEAKQCRMAEDKIIKAVGGMLSRVQ